MAIAVLLRIFFRSSSIAFLCLLTRECHFQRAFARGFTRLNGLLVRVQPIYESLELRDFFELRFYSKPSHSNGSGRKEDLSLAWQPRSLLYDFDRNHFFRRICHVTYRKNNGSKQPRYF